MPERLAKTDPYQQVTETVGSGPFKFVTSEFQPGHKALYVKNADYVPRTEPRAARSTRSNGSICPSTRPQPRRASKKPVADGGWSIFGTGWTDVETLDPSSNLPLAANGGAAWFGWPSDDRLEELRSEWLRTDESEARQEIAVEIQRRAFEILPYAPTGQWSPTTAYRENVKGVIICPTLFMWNVEKT